MIPSVSESRQQEERRGRRADAVLSTPRMSSTSASPPCSSSQPCAARRPATSSRLRHGLESAPIVEVLDTLLLVFIVVELLFAVRTTVEKRELVAEPFLLVGIIASIKEIVVLSVKAAEDIGKGSTFRDQLWQIGVLGVVILLLGATAWLLRVKEREPAEGATVSD